MEFPIQTRLCNGLSAVVLWDSNEGPKPLIGAYFTPTDGWGWLPISWTKEGYFHIDKERQKEYNHLNLEWVTPEPLYA